MKRCNVPAVLAWLPVPAACTTSTAKTGWRWLVGLLCLLILGCVPEVAHVPNARLLDTMQLAEVHQRLQDVLSRSINPRVMNVQITDDFIQYSYQQVVPGPWFTPVSTGMID